MKKGNFICSECGAVLTEENVHTFDGHTMCEDCFNRCTTVCDNCQTRIWRDNAEGDSNYVLCSRCYEHCYTTCEDCGRLIHNEDAFYEDGEDYPFCRECFEKLNDSAIKNYSYKPEPIFYGSGNIFYGVELEIDKGGEDNSNAQKLLDIANLFWERIYCKHDGSLNEGFEIVSHPMSLDYHLKEMNWAEVFNKAVEMGYRSHNTATCGLHVHCSRSAFGETEPEQEAAIGRVVFFVEKHWNELVRFSRRTSDNLNRWAAKYATISNTTYETYKKAKDKHMGRYVAVNLENDSTIEFRLFRGTLCYKTFVATLQLVSEICKTAIRLTDRELEEMSWSDWVLSINKTSNSEFIEYLKSKRLYVNEITNETEEV